MPRARIFHGWIVVAHLVFVQVLTIGFLFYGFGVLLDPIAHSLGLSRGETAYGFSLFTLGNAFWAPVMAAWVERRGSRRPLLAGLLALAAGLLVLGEVRNRWAFYAVMGIWLSFGVSASAGVPQSTLVVNWFRRHRGMALSLTSAGVSLGGLLLAPAVGYLIPLVGWNRAVLLPAGLLLLAFPLGLKVIRNRPEELGLHRDGDAVDTPDPGEGEDLPIGRILSDPNFLRIAFGFALAMSAMTSLMVHVVGIWTDLGMSQGRAALGFALVAGVGMAGKPFFGWLADRVDARRGAVVSYALLMAGTVSLYWPSTWNAVPFVIFFGLGLGGAVPMQGAINGELYGRTHFARVSGLLTPWIVTIQALSYAITGYVLDHLGGYSTLYGLACALYVISMILLLGVNRSRVIEPVGTGAV